MWDTRDEYLGYSVALDDAHDSLSFSHQFSEHIDLHGRGNANDGFYAQRSQAAESLSYKIISLKYSQLAFFPVLRFSMGICPVKFSTKIFTEEYLFAFRLPIL